MRPYKFYRHDDSTDLIIECIKSFQIAPKRLSVKAKLYTCGYPGKLVFMDTARWEINEENYNKWRPYDSQTRIQS